MLRLDVPGERGATRRWPRVDQALRASDHLMHVGKRAACGKASTGGDIEIAHPTHMVLLTDEMRNRGSQRKRSGMKRSTGSLERPLMSTAQTPIWVWWLFNGGIWWR